MDPSFFEIRNGFVCNEVRFNNPIFNIYQPEIQNVLQLTCFSNSDQLYKIKVKIKNENQAMLLAVEKILG